MLAGGRSRRMGRDKAQLPYGGSTLLEHALRTLRQAGFAPGVAGVSGNLECSAPIIKDAFLGDGPLAGMEAALRTVAHEMPAGTSQNVLFTPVDLPLLPAAFYQAIRERAQRTGALVTVPSVEGRLQPLCTVLSTELGTGIAASLAAGDRKAMRVMAAAATELWAQHSLTASTTRGNPIDTFRMEALAAAQGWHGTHRWFTNVNTPGDWDIAARDEAGRLPAASREAEAR